MLNRITMEAGSTPTQPPLEVELTSVTVFVGPNNSGKSRALQEIENWIKSPKPLNGLVIKSIKFEAWTNAGIEEAINELEIEPKLNEVLNPDHVLIGTLHPQNNSPVRMQIHKPSLLQEAKKPDSLRHRYAPFLSLFTLKLDGTNRLALANPQKSGDLLDTAPNHLAHLFVNNAARSKLRKIVRDAFGKHLVVDPTNIGTSFSLVHLEPQLMNAKRKVGIREPRCFTKQLCRLLMLVTESRHS